MLIIGAGDIQITEDISLLNKDFCIFKNIFLEILYLLLSFYHYFLGTEVV